MEFFSLDIGSVTTKLVKLQRIGKDKFRLEGAAMIETPPGGITADAEANWVAMAEAIKKGLAEAKITTKYVVAGLTESEVFTRVVTMPKMTSTELQTAIGWEAEQNIPLPVSEVNYDYSVVDTKEDGSQEVMIVAAPKRLVEKYERVLKLAELTPVGLETNLLAVCRAVVSLDEKNPIFIVNLGANSTEIGIVKSGNLVFSRSVATAGEALTRALMTGLQLDVTQAESYKRTYGMTVTQLEGKVAATMQPIVETFIREIKRAVNFYETKSGGAKVKTVILSGGTANLPDLAPLLTKGLNIEVQIGNALQKVVSQKVDLSTEQGAIYAVAIGLAMKEI